MQLQHYACGEWVDTRKDIELRDASNGEVIATTSSEKIDIEAMFHFGRKTGSKNLRKLTFHERARMLKALALYLLEKKEKFYEISYATGATKVDSWIDIEGGIGNLFVYSSKGRRELPDTPFVLDGKPEVLSREGTFIGHHLYVPKPGVALHINAFNFPVWGMLEKIAVNLLAGVPAIVKPATATCFLTEVVFKEIIASNILPKGSLQLICGPARNLLDYADSQDVITFTGSASTGMKLRSHPRINEYSIPFNMEADSLNSCILGPDVTPGSEDFKVFIKEVAKEMTVKAGQKCTAIRRIIVPQNSIDAVQEALIERLSKTTIGDPRTEGVRMGPLVSVDQRSDVLQKIKELKTSSELLYQGEKNQYLSDKEKGCFVPPTLLHCKNPLKDMEPHNVEAFGPVSTIMAYNDLDQASELVALGKGSLVSSLISSDKKVIQEVVLSSAAYNGRFLVLNKDCAKESTGHGSPMPQLVHGGPGRAGGGEEMGGLRGVYHYMQRTAIQGHPSSISAISNVYHYGAEQTSDVRHPFSKYFDELEVGETLLTQKRTITDSDISNFANLSWDHFYAHVDETSLEGTIFEKKVAHGYFIISAAAGLFVKGDKGPVLANYGLDELRFTKPVYAGNTIQVKLTVKEKIAQDPRPDESPRGIVKWLVDVIDESGETVALATILTLVARTPEIDEKK
ncbi:MAG: phenylacetic acid degradation bifunctional protein PaaZ [Bacteriovoracaceae bacterium]